MESRDSLRKWEQSTWPEDDFTVESNLEDMQTMQDRHSAGTAFGYTVMNPSETECLGCVYVLSPRSKMFTDAVATSEGERDWSDVDATVFFWIRESRLAEELDRQILEAMQRWFVDEWPFTQPVFVTNEQFEQQVAMLDSTELALRYRVKVPKDPGAYLAYAYLWSESETIERSQRGHQRRCVKSQRSPRSRPDSSGL